MKNIQPFHIAIPVSNLVECRKFYKEILGWEEVVIFGWILIFSDTNW